MFAAITVTYYVLVGSMMSPGAGLVPADYAAYHGCMQSGMLRMVMTPPSGPRTIGGPSNAKFEAIQSRCEPYAPADMPTGTANATGSPVDVIVG